MAAAMTLLNVNSQLTSLCGYFKSALHCANRFLGDTFCTFYYLESLIVGGSTAAASSYTDGCCCY